MCFHFNVVFQIISDSSHLASSLLPLTPDHFGRLILNIKRYQVSGSMKKKQTHIDISNCPFRKALSQVKAFVKGTMVCSGFFKHTDTTHTHALKRIVDCSRNIQLCRSLTGLWQWLGLACVSLGRVKLRCMAVCWEGMRTKEMQTNHFIFTVSLQ